MSKRGRPTDYKPEYCQELIDHMKEGYSYETFAPKIGVSKQTIYDWEKVNPDFLDAKKKAFGYCQLHWEKVGVDGAVGNNKINPSVWIFNMKNRFNWTDRQDVRVGNEENKKFELAYKVE